MLHIATIVEKRSTETGNVIYSIICAQCSDEAEDYIRCSYISNCPFEVVEHKPKKMSVLDKIMTALNYHR